MLAPLTKYGHPTWRGRPGIPWPLIKCSVGNVATAARCYLYSPYFKKQARAGGLDWIGINRAIASVPMSHGDAIHLLHREAAKQHELAAQSHRTASEHNEKGDNPTGNWHTQRALEYSDRAYELAKEAHNRSGQIGSL